MTAFRIFLPLVFPALLAAAAAPTPLEIVVRDIPAGTREVVVLLDAAIRPPGPEYIEPAIPVAPAVAATAPTTAPLQQVIQQVPTAAAAPNAAAPAAEEPRRRRRTVTGPVIVPQRHLATVSGTSATVRTTLPLSDGYQARVIALRSDDAFPTVLAAGRIDQVKVDANSPAPLSISLIPPTLKLAPTTPTSVSPGATYKLAGTIVDAGRALGTKNRMRVWISAGTPPKMNYAGTQTSTVEVTTTDDDIYFTFELTAPAKPTTLYFQFGEIPSDFAAADGAPAPFLVLPNIGAGAKPLELVVQ